MQTCKKWLSVCLMLVLVGLCLLLLPLEAQADTSGSYIYKVTDNKATIVKCNTDVSGAITIPSKLGGYPVTAIGERAFEDCKKMTAVTIPNGVTSIGICAFLDCEKLETINVPDSVVHFGSNAFYYTKWYENQPYGVVYAGKAAIDYKRGMMVAYENITIEIKAGTKVIGDNAITGMNFWTQKIVSVKLPDSIIAIGNRAFWNCSDLTEFTIPGNVTSIGDNAFQECSKLTKVNIPASVKKLGNNVFYGCNSLADISVASGNTAFWSDAKGVLFSKDKTVLIAAPRTLSGSYTIPNTVKTIAAGALWGCGNMTAISIPDSVTTIGEGAFVGCNGLKSVKIPSGVTVIPKNAFNSCENLKNVTIPNTVTSIGDNAFYFTNISSLKLPASLTHIGSCAFDCCYNLSTVTGGANVCYVDEYAFDGTHWLSSKPDGIVYLGKVALWCKGDPTTVTIKEGTVAIAPSAFVLCENLKTIKFPESITSVGDYALEKTLWYQNLPKGAVYVGKVLYAYIGECPSSVTVKAGTVSINKQVFSGQSTLKSVSIPESVTTLGDYAFGGCTALKTVNIPKNVTAIAYRTFSGCTSLSTVTIPASVKTIDNSFASCDALKNVSYLGTVKQWEQVTRTGRPNTDIEIADICFAGFYNRNGNRYYGENGKNVTGWKAIGGKKYYFKWGTGGTMATDWTTIGGQKYYFSKVNGAMVTGVVAIGGVYHQFNSAGVWQRQIPAPKITRQPATVIVANGKTAAVSIAASGEGLTYKWYFKDRSASKFSLTNSFTGTSYSVAMNTSRAGRQVYCVVTDKYGQTVKTNTVTLRMTGAAYITKQPVSVRAVNGKTAKVAFTATGDGLKYTWHFKNAGAAGFSKTTAFTGNNYSVTMDKTRSGRQLYCVVTDKYGVSVKTDVVTISMIPAIKITKQPASVKVANGQTAKVALTASGEGLKYAWYFKNAGAAGFSKTTAFAGNTYSVTMDKTRSGRQLYCVVTDKYGQKVQTNIVTVSMAAAPKITKQPVSVKAISGKNVTVSLAASGEGLTYKWYYKNKSASSFSLTTSYKGASYTAQMNEERDGRQLYCVVTDKYGQSVKTNTVTISMIPAPKITREPESVTVAEGKNAVVSFVASGEGLTYKWYFENWGDSKYTYTSSYKGTTYSVQMSQARHLRSVYCEITDKYGQKVETYPVTLYMADKPEIHSAVIVPRGENLLEYRVFVRGEGLTYAWYYKNPGDSAFKYTSAYKGYNYTIEVTPEREGRQIYCVVTDKYGQSVKSDVYTLTR